MVLFSSFVLNTTNTSLRYLLRASVLLCPMLLTPGVAQADWHLDLAKSQCGKAPDKLVCPETKIGDSRKEFKIGGGISCGVTKLKITKLPERTYLESRSLYCVLGDYTSSIIVSCRDNFVRGELIIDGKNGKFIDSPTLMCTGK